MTVPRFYAVGFCAHYSRPGDWAFDFALRISQENALQLNVFHFLDDPYCPDQNAEQKYSTQELATISFEKERDLRMYYDELAGDYVEVGFRLCFDDSWRELHRCLFGREFQMLVLAKPEADTTFAGKSIEEFADSMVCPVVIVGPEGAEQVQLNSRAALLSDIIGMRPSGWSLIEPGRMPLSSSPRMILPG